MVILFRKNFRVENYPPMMVTTATEDRMVTFKQYHVIKKV